MDSEEVSDSGRTRPGLEKDLQEGVFECLCCPHVETNIDYLMSSEGSWCSKCGDELYYWPDAQTTTFGISVDAMTMISTVYEKP